MVSQSILLRTPRTTPPPATVAFITRRQSQQQQQQQQRRIVLNSNNRIMYYNYSCYSTVIQQQQQQQQQQCQQKQQYPKSIISVPINYRGGCDYNKSDYATTAEKRRINNNYLPVITTTVRSLSTISRGYDLTDDLLATNPNDDNSNDPTKKIPKITLSSYAPSGFDVMNSVKRHDTTEINPEQGLVHMNSSIIVVPNGCFLWNTITRPNQVTVESLSFFILYRPKLQYLFLGYNSTAHEQPIPRTEFIKIQETFLKYGIVVTELSLDNAIGTFNLLNAEDRYVAAALILDPEP